MEQSIGNIEDLYKQYSEEFSDKELVFGDGNPSTGIVMVGEAPGKDEVRLGRPFVGIAGGNLGEFMEYLEMTREDIYVTNAIKYRLFKINPSTKRKSNRPAKKHEILSSRPYLLQELKKLGAKIVITLGNVSLKAVTGRFDTSIGKVHGNMLKLDDMVIFPLYHPASLIYNKAIEEIYFRDLDILKLLIKEERI